jgi:hypothetical protein
MSERADHLLPRALLQFERSPVLRFFAVIGVAALAMRALTGTTLHERNDPPAEPGAAAIAFNDSDGLN